jgi:hypothetical protein
LHSCIYVTKLSFGEINEAPFFYGENHDYTVYLVIFFYTSVIILLIGLLNILIAMMASIYTERVIVADQVRIRDHLHFVVNNWYLLDIAFKDKHQTKYIITAFLDKKEISDKNLLSNLYDEVTEIKEKVTTDFDQAKLKQSELCNIVDKLDKNVHHLSFNMRLA